MKYLMFNFLFCFFLATHAKADTVDNYQIYIKKILVRNDSGFPPHFKNQQYISLDRSLCNESLAIYFHHCIGYIGKRKITVVDVNGHVVKAFEFTATGYNDEMSIPISFFCADAIIQSNVAYSLVYYDGFVTAGRYLTEIRIKK